MLSDQFGDLLAQATQVPLYLSVQLDGLKLLRDLRTGIAANRTGGVTRTAAIPPVVPPITAPCLITAPLAMLIVARPSMVLVAIRTVVVTMPGAIAGVGLSGLVATTVGVFGRRIVRAHRRIPVGAVRGPNPISRAALVCPRRRALNGGQLVGGRGLVSSP